MTNSVDGQPRVVVSAMKKQLRGRFRRNVETLLEAGMHVTVVAIKSRDDFFVGLEHPRLSVELVLPGTPYSRHAAQVRRRRASRVAVVRLRLGRARRALIREALARGGTLRHAREVLRDQPTYRVPGGVVRPFPAATIPFLVAGLVTFLLVRSLGGGRRGLPGAGGARGRASHAGHHRSSSFLRGVYRYLRRAVWGHGRRAGRRLRDRCDCLVSAGLKPFARVASYREFWRLSGECVQRLRPDLVVTSDVPGLVGAARSARRLGIPHVHDCHELFLGSTSLRWFERLLLAPVERRHMRRATRVVAVNGSIAAEYRRRYGVRPIVVRNCADAPEALAVRDLRELAGLPGAAAVVLYQGGFIQGRGLDVCVEALSQLPDDVHLVMLGYGPMEGELRDRADGAGVAGRLHVVPAVLPSELLSLTASASVGVIPYQPVSANNRLTLPNKVFEYVSVGLPLVTSDLPELREIVVGHGCGLVYDPYDPVALAAALRSALEPDAAVRFRAASQRFGEENTWQAEREVLLGAFMDALLLGRQGSRREHGRAVGSAPRAAQGIRARARIGVMR